jgi:threonine dehydrogenase-like Zn-dependent dehydrogenase
MVPKTSHNPITSLTEERNGTSGYSQTSEKLSRVLPAQAMASGRKGEGVLRPEGVWPAPVRRYLPELIKLVLDRKINPGKFFDLTLPLDQVAEGYRAIAADGLFE